MHTEKLTDQCQGPSSWCNQEKGTPNYSHTVNNRSSYSPYSNKSLAEDGFKSLTGVLMTAYHQAILTPDNSEH